MSPITGTTRLRHLASAISLGVLALCGAASAQVAPTDATITVHADQPGAHINREVFTQFAEHLGHGIYEGIWVGPGSSIPNTKGYRTDVIDGAVAILDQYGLADLTMRRLATSLHVQPGALYWHFPNKQALLGAVADRILAPMEDPVDTDEWSGQIGELAHRLRSCLLAYRDGAEVVSATYASRLTTSKGRERLAGALIRGGMTREEADLAAYTLLYYVLGETVDEQ